MNYYEHHLGDYAKDTAHLNMLEHGAYRLLLDRYYGTEQPIQADQAHRIARARSREEKTAVDAVLQEFFSRDGDVWRNSRADQEIAKFAAKKPKADEKREADKVRQQRARERRKALFEQLSALGVHMAWNCTTEELTAALDRAVSQANHADVTPPVTRDNTATQTPDTSHQTPVDLASGIGESTDVHARAPSTAPPDISPAARVCLGLKALGYSDTSPHDAVLTATLQAGITAEEIIAVGESAKGKGKGFRWVLATAEGRRRDAAKVTPLPAAGDSFDNRNYGTGGRL